VRGQVAPGETVRIGVILRTTAGTDAPFECRSQAGADGLFEIRFPYASTATEGIQRRSPVLLIVGTPSADNPPAPINIPQDAVENGLIVEMAL
jgi:hypothetical protein